MTTKSQNAAAYLRFASKHDISTAHCIAIPAVFERMAETAGMGTDAFLRAAMSNDALGNYVAEIIEGIPVTEILREQELKSRG